MLNFLMVILLILFTPLKSYGFGWGDVGECVTDPCNCGHGDRRETWGGVTVNKGDEDYNCPPYDKTSGRTSCLKQFDWIRAGTQFYHKVCAEEAPGSTYGNPKIRIRSQACNGLACWTVREDLKWNGQCVVLGGPYGAPMKRVCARVAVKRFRTNPDTGEEEVLSTDQGYDNFAGKHLDHEGFTVDDDPVYDADGNEFTELYPPKLCAYSDPSVLALNSLDILDILPNKQSMHKTSDIHPIVEDLIALVDLATTLGTAYYDLLSQLWDFLGNASGSGFIDTVTNVISDIYSFISDIIEFLGENVVVGALEAIGQINRIVDTSPITYGCVNIPLGPMPPPFPDSLQSSSSPPTTQFVCPLDQNTDPKVPIQSITTAPCVFSELTNNAINNVIRVGYNDFIPLCSSTQDPMVTDKCVNIENYSAFSTPEILNTSTAYRNLLKKCEDAAPGAPCIRTKLPLECSVSANGCEDGYRIAYSAKIGNRSVPTNYFNYDLPPCSDGVSPCQVVWGINVGEFVDVAVRFPEREIDYSGLTLSQAFSLKNNKGEIVPFQATVNRVTPADSVDEEAIESPGQICVSFGGQIISCENRVAPINTGVYECGYNGINCFPDTTFFRPKLILSTTIDGFTSSSIFEVKNMYSQNNNDAYLMNHLGRDFDSFATNDAFRQMPFEGSDAPAPNTLFGTYLDDILPLDIATNVQNPNAVYLTGLEYISGAYSVGGTQMCLNPSGLRQCPEDPTMCVLANLLERDDVQCDEFFERNV